MSHVLAYLLGSNVEELSKKRNVLYQNHGLNPRRASLARSPFPFCLGVRVRTFIGIGAVDALSVSLTDRYKKKRKEITC